MNKELASLRKNYEPFEEETTRLLRQMTIQESLQAYAELFAAFEWQLAQTAQLFQAERFETLAKLQERLRRFEKWNREQNG